MVNANLQVSPIIFFDIGLLKISICLSADMLKTPICMGISHVFVEFTALHINVDADKHC